MLMHELLTSQKAKIAGVMSYAFKQDLSDRPTLDECVKCVQILDLQKPIKEKARVRAKQKFGKDEWRPIADFGIQHRTAQEMVRAILAKTFRPRVFQYTHRGVAPAIARIRAQVQAGRHYFVHQDIVSFFMNFEEEKLKVALPLPIWAVEHVVVGRQIVWAAQGGGLSSSLHQLTA